MSEFKMEDVEDVPGFLRLKDAIDARDIRVERATQGAWSYHPFQAWSIGEHIFAYVEVKSDLPVSPMAPAGPVAITGPHDDSQSRYDADFIAAESPAEVFRHVIRDQQVLDKHRPVKDPNRGEGIWCARCWNDSSWPCMDVELMADAYRVNLGDRRDLYAG